METIIRKTFNVKSHKVVKVTQTCNGIKVYLDRNKRRRLPCGQYGTRARVRDRLEPKYQWCCGMLKQQSQSGEPSLLWLSHRRNFHLSFISLLRKTTRARNHAQILVRNLFSFPPPAFYLPLFLPYSVPHRHIPILLLTLVGWAMPMLFSQQKSVSKI